jgi:hypothetical protein
MFLAVALSGVELPCMGLGGVRLGGVRLAAAAPARGYQLAWDVPPEAGCGSAAQFVELVEARLGRDVFGVEAESKVLLSLTIGEQWELRLRVSEGTTQLLAERSWIAPAGDCAGVLASAALALELMLNDEQQQDAPPSAATVPDAANTPEAASGVPAALSASESQLLLAPLPAPAPSEIPQPAEVEPRESKSTKPKQPTKPKAPSSGNGPRESPDGSVGGARGTASRRWSVAALGSGYWGVLPAFTWGAGFDLGYSFDRGVAVRLGAGVTQTASGSRDFEADRVSLGVSLWRVGAEVSVELIRSGGFSQRVGLVGHLGRLEFDVEGDATRLRSNTLWWAVGARTSSEVALSGVWSLRGDAELVAQRADEFQIRIDQGERQTLTALEPVGGLVSLGVVARF